MFIRHYKDVIVVVSRHDNYGVPPGMPKHVSAQKHQHTASRKDLLDGARLEIRLASMQDQSTL